MGQDLIRCGDLRLRLPGGRWNRGVGGQCTPGLGRGQSALSMPIRLAEFVAAQPTEAKVMPLARVAQAGGRREPGQLRCGVAKEPRESA